MKPKQTDERSAIIARHYEVFLRYPASRQTMSACSCCVCDEEIAALFSVPLSRLPAEKMRRYAAKAMTTGGDERDWKHFLPRLCELALKSTRANYLDLDWIGNKFSMVNWPNGPPMKRRACANSGAS